MNSALLILARDSRVPAIRAKPGWADISQVFEGEDISRFWMETTKSAPENICAFSFQVYPSSPRFSDSPIHPTPNPCPLIPDPCPLLKLPFLPHASINKMNPFPKIPKENSTGL